MDIFRKRYGSTNSLILDLMANKKFDEYLRDLFLEKSKRIKEIEDGIKIIPDQWNDEKHLFGFLSPLGLPIYEKGMPQHGYKKRFQEQWENYYNGKNFERNFKIVSATSRQPASEEIESFIHWRDSQNKEQLAFIFFGILWMYQDPKETLEASAKRFLESHPDLQRDLEGSAKKKRILLTEPKQMSTQLWENGALLFLPSNQIVGKRDCEEDPTTKIWTILAAEGYFSGIKEIDLLNNEAYLMKLLKA